MADDQVENVTDYRGKLWRSLVTDIKARLTEEEATGLLSEPSLEEILDNEFILTSKDGYISVWLVPETGDGSWNQLLPIEQCEPWFVWPNGDVEINGNLMNIPDAANWFVSRLIAK